MGSSVDYTIIYSKERYKYETEALRFFMAPCLQRLKDYAHTALLSYLRGMIHNARSLMSACVASRRALDPSRLRLARILINPGRRATSPELRRRRAFTHGDIETPGGSDALVLCR